MSSVVSGKVGLCVCTFNRRRCLEACLKTLFDTTARAADAYYLVVDDHSTDSTLDFLASFQQENPRLNVLIKSKNRGYVDSFNRSLDLAARHGCDVIFLINDDITFRKEGWVEFYCRAIEKTGIQHFNFMDGRNVAGRRTAEEVTITYHTWVRGCLEVVTRKVFETLGGYDLRFHGLGCMDTEFSDRAILGGLTDDTLVNLLESHLVSYGNLSMGFCADVEGSREFISDPHPNMGICNTVSSFGSRKQAAVATLRRLRVQRGLYRQYDAQALTSLCYHQVGGGDAIVDPTNDCTSQKDFRDHIRMIKALGYHFVSADQLLDSQSLPEKPVLLTFDDGYRNNYVNARPVLLDEGIRAIVFLSTGYVGSEEIRGYDLLVHLLRARPFSDILDATKQIGHRVPVFEEGGAPITNPSFRYHFRSDLSLEEQTEIAENLCARLEFRLPAAITQGLYVSWDDLEAMKDTFDFGAHTVHHPLLSEVAPEQARLEIQESKKTLESKVGPVRWFAYPYGYPNSYGDRDKQILTEEGFCGAFTTVPMQTALPLEDAFEIGRHCIGDENARDLVKYIGLRV